MAVLLALDPGERRTGIALCDPAQILASPLRTHDRQRDGSLFDLLEELCEEHAVEKILVGHPLTQGGEVGETAQRSELLARRLRGRLQGKRIDVELVDERYSTAEAQRLLAGSRHDRADRDALAAALILQSYLDARRPPAEGA